MPYKYKKKSNAEKCSDKDFVQAGYEDLSGFETINEEGNLSEMQRIINPEIILTATTGSLSPFEEIISPQGFEYSLPEKFRQQLPLWNEYRQKGYNIIKITPDLDSLTKLENMIPDLILTAPEELQPVIIHLRDAVQGLIASLKTSWNEQKLQSQNRKELTKITVLDASVGGGMVRRSLLSVNEMAEVINKLTVALATVLAELKVIATLMDSAMPDKVETALVENLVNEIENSLNDSGEIEYAEYEVTAMLSGNAPPEIQGRFSELLNSAAEEITTSLTQHLSVSLKMIKNTAADAKFQARKISRANRNSRDIATAIEKLSHSLNSASCAVEAIKARVSPSDSQIDRLKKNIKNVPKEIKTGAGKLGNKFLSGIEKLGEVAPENVSEVSFITLSPPVRRDDDNTLWNAWQALTNKIKKNISHARLARLKAQSLFTQYNTPDTPETVEFSAKLKSISLPFLAVTQKLLVATGQLEATLHMAKKTRVQRDGSQPVPTEHQNSDVKKSPEQTLREVLDAALERTSASFRKAALTEQQNLQLLSSLHASAETARTTAEEVKKQVKEEKLIIEMETALQQVAIFPQLLRKAAEARLDAFAVPFKKIVRDLTATADQLIAASLFDIELVEPTLKAVTAVKYQAAAIKREIQQVITAATGTPLRNYSRSGMLAKAIGEWLANEKLALMQSGSDIDPKIIDRITGQLLKNELKDAFIKQNDPLGEVMSKRVALAVNDAMSGTMLWPQTPEERLARSRAPLEHMLSWSERRVTNVARFVGYGNDALNKLISPYPRNNLLRPRIRYLRLLLAPVSIALGVREMKKLVRPGNPLPSDLINEYIRREVFKSAFRLVTFMLPPLVNHGMALALTGYGLYRGGTYRDEFLERAIARLPTDALWEGGYAGVNATWQGLSRPAGNIAEQIQLQWPTYPSSIWQQQSYAKEMEDFWSRSKRDTVKQDAMLVSPPHEELDIEINQGYGTDSAKERNKFNLEENERLKISAMEWWLKEKWEENGERYNINSAVNSGRYGGPLVSSHGNELKAHFSLTLKKWLLDDIKKTIKYLIETTVDYDSYPHDVADIIKKSLIQGAKEVITPEAFFRMANFELTKHFLDNYKKNNDVKAFYFLKAKKEMHHKIKEITLNNSEIDLHEYELLNEINMHYDEDALTYYNAQFLPEEVDYAKYTSATDSYYGVKNEHDQWTEQSLDNKIAIKNRVIDITAASLKRAEIALPRPLYPDELTGSELEYVNKIQKPGEARIKELLDKDFDEKLEYLRLIEEKKQIKDGLKKNSVSSYIEGISFFEKEYNDRINSGDDEDVVMNDILHQIVIMESQIRKGKNGVYSEEESHDLEKLNVAKYHLFSHKKLYKIHDEIVISLSDSNEGIYKFNNSVSDVFDSRLNAVKKIFSDEGLSVTNGIDYDKEYNEIISAGNEKSSLLYQMTATIFYKKHHPDEDLLSVSPEKILSYYRVKSESSMHDLFFFKNTVPEKYIPVETFEGSDSFQNRREYVDQFNDYITNGSSQYDAENATPVILGHLGLSVDDLASPAERLIFFKPGVVHSRRMSGQAELDGAVCMIKLKSDNYIFISSINGKIKTVSISGDELWNGTFSSTPPFRKGDWVYETHPKHWLTQKLFGDVLPPEGYEDIDSFNLQCVSDINSQGKQQGSLKVSVAAAMKKIYDSRADVAKSHLEYHSKLENFFMAIIPFLKQIYYASTDPRYKLDENTLVSDVIFVSMALASFGVDLALIGEQTAAEISEIIRAKKISGFTGKALAKEVLAELPGLGIDVSAKLSKAAAGTALDLISPVPVRDMSKKLFTSIYKEEAGTDLLKNIPYGSHFPESWGRNDINLDYHTAKNGIYEIKPDYAQSMRDFEYFIKQDDKIYQVRWDATFNTWRLIKPSLIRGEMFYAPAVRLNKDGLWEVHTDFGLRGGLNKPGYSAFKKWIKGNRILPTAEKQLSEGDVSIFRGRGYLGASDDTEIETPFEYARFDASHNLPAKTFTMNSINTGSEIEGVISVSKGSKLSSKTSGIMFGKWGAKIKLDDTVEFIEVSNGASGTVGIKIPLNQLPEGKPVIVSAGELSGCTMIYAVDKDYFYAYHAGQKPGDDTWLTSRDGVESIYKAHMSLNGTPVPDISPWHNNELTKIFSTYESSTVNYLGKNTPLTGDTRISTDFGSSVNTFDYNAAKNENNDPRMGLAYALLIRKNGKTSVSTYSDDMVMSLTNNKTKSLSTQENKIYEHDSNSRFNSAKSGKKSRLLFSHHDYTGDFTRGEARINKLNKFALEHSRNYMRTKHFNPISNSYQINKDFTVIPVGDLLPQKEVTLSEQNAIKAASSMEQQGTKLLDNFRSNYERLDDNDMIAGGNLNASVGYLRHLAAEIKHNDPAAFIFALVKKGNYKEVPTDQVYGFMSIRYDFSHKMEVVYLVAHPYVIASKNPHIATQFLSSADRAKYNIKDVAMHLGGAGLKQSIDFVENIPGSRPIEAISANTVNPVTEAMIASFNNIKLPDVNPFKQKRH